MKKEVKILVNEEINAGYLDWSGVSIDKIREDLLMLEEMGVTHINIDTEDSYGYSSLNIQPIKTRLETDEEYKIRLQEEKIRKQNKKKWELEELKRLQNKYKKESSK